MNMEIIGPFILTFISGLSTLLSLLMMLFKSKNVIKSTIYFLSISFFMMIMISIFELMPNAIKTIIGEYNYFLGIIITILIFSLGYNSTIFIDKFINYESNLYKIGIKNLIILTLHNILEGMVVFTSSIHNLKIGLKIASAIIIHNISEGISIVIPMYNGGGKKSKIICYTLLSAFSEPLGALLSYVFLKKYLNTVLLAFILIFVSGLMISISINDILKEIISYKNNKYMIYGLITSIIIFILIL